MLTTVRGALGLVDAWTRRRVAVSAGLALALAGLEMVAFGLLYVLIRAVSGGNSDTGVMNALGRAGIEDPNRQLSALGLLVVAIMLLKSATAVAISRWQSKVQNVSEARLATALFREYVGQDFLFHVHRNSATLIRNLTSSIGMVATSVVGSLTSLTTDGFVLLGTLAVLAVVAPGLAIGLAAFALVVLLGYMLVIGPIIQRAAATDQILTGTTMQAMQEAFSGIKSVHVFNFESAVGKAYSAQRSELAESRSILAFVQRLPQYYLEVCLVLGAATATAVMIEAVGRTEAFSLLALLVVAALRVLPSVARILGSLNAIRSGGAAVSLLQQERSLLPLRHREGQTTAPGPGATLAPRPATVTFHDVSFAYPLRPDHVLSSVDVHVGAGQIVGIVGPSGAGKTTLVDILLGLLEPTGGTVHVDDVLLDRTNRSAWRNRVGYVPQETYLLDGSIRQNVLFHRTSPSHADEDTRIWDALISAQLATTVRELPGGLDAQVGERGVRLSGGQRQRLGIARALLASPSVLVLDEATSALDGATEAAIGRTISGLRGQLTVVVIAHRLSTVRDCDTLILLEHGRVVATGSLHDLAQKSPAFAVTLGLADIRLGARE